uniref:Beta-defensin n=1 Tax=Capra hircus TaxID=9925 RepID=A0A8C2RBH7_CAPHI
MLSSESLSQSIFTNSILPIITAPLLYYCVLTTYHFLKLSYSIFVCGLLSTVNHCLNLNGICRRDTCKLTEGTVATCRRKWKCCCTWWILFLVPTPVIYSDYQAPHKKIGK